MTQEEMRNVMNVLFVSYPASFRDWTEGQFTTAKNLWYDMFKTIPYPVMMKAIKKSIGSNRTNFAPSIGEVMYQVKELLSIYDANTAWEDVCYIVRSIDIEDVPKSVKALDAIAQKIITTQDIQRMKNVPGSVDKERPSFIATYNRMKDGRESDAIETGNLMSITNETKLLGLGVKQADIQMQIGFKQNG